jgi:hypothetical protein
LTFAEDIVRGKAELADCIFNLSQKVTELPQELSGLPNKSAPSSLIKSKISKATKKRIKE